mmetsp:Transcript_55751/g.90298  ORF Transcript_55751/g.90298 Transcript_55751/m.90298 type:complete len:112 (+) Transcript_55751:1101-1436(+)
MYRDSTEGERACWRFDQKYILIGNPKFVIGSTKTTVMCGCHDSRHTTEEGFAQSQTTIEGAAHGGLILSNYKWLSTEPSPFHAASKEVVMKRLQMLSQLPAQEPFESRLCA